MGAEAVTEMAFKEYTERETIVLLEAKVDQLDALVRKLETVLHDINRESVKWAELSMRVGRLETIVFGSLATVLLGVMGALLKLVVR